MRGRRAAAAAIGAAMGAAAVAMALAPAANGASRTVTLEGWWPREMAFSGRALVWSETAPVRIDPRRFPGAPPGVVPFTYYRAEGFRARLDRASRRFVTTPETLISIRTSIAGMTPGALAPMAGEGLVMAPFSRRFAAPVVACCTPDGEEIDVESDGRPGALPNVAVESGFGDIRWVQLQPDGTQVMRSQARPATSAGERSARGLVALAPGLRAWVDPAAPRTLLLGADGPVPAPRAVALPGDALRVWAARGVVVVAVRRGARVELRRTTSGGGTARIWSGGRLPRVAVGGASVAAADGRVVLASRRGALRRVTTARRRVDAVAINGRRLAWSERATRRGARVAVVRLARIR